MGSKVSIIIPAYNVALYIGRCVDSLLRQTYTNIEIIIINDGSTDSTGVICNKLAIRDNRIKVFHSSNGGVSSARNLGVKESDGEYIMFVDGDDWLEPYAVELLVDNVTRTGSDLCFCSKHFRNETEIITTTRVESNDNYPALELLQKHLNYEFIASPCLSIIKKEKVLCVRFNQEIHTLEDWEYNFQLLACANNVSLIDKPYYHYRAVEGSASKSPLNSRKITCFKIFDSVEKRVQMLAEKHKLYTDNVPCFLIYHMLVIYSSNGSLNDAYAKLIEFSRKHLFDVLLSKKISIKNKIYVTMGSISPKIFKYLFNIKNN